MGGPWSNGWCPYKKTEAHRESSSRDDTDRDKGAVQVTTEAERAVTRSHAEGRQAVRANTGGWVEAPSGFSLSPEGDPILRRPGSQISAFRTARLWHSVAATPGGRAGASEPGAGGMALLR